MKSLFVQAILGSLLVILTACGSEEPETIDMIATAIPTFTPAAPRAAVAAAPTRLPATATPVATATESSPAIDAADIATEDVATADVATDAVPVAESTQDETSAPAATSVESTATPDAGSAQVVDAGSAQQAQDSETEEETAAGDDLENAPTDDAAADESESVQTGDDTAAAALNLIPDALAALVETGDPARGEQLTLTNACIACHNIDPSVQMAGPTWHNLVETAETRVEGQRAVDYLYNSIIYPNDYVVDGYVAGLMLQTFGETISDEDLADIIAYLLTLKEMN